jgi:uncharacterized membrane protein YdbT with pleckstrin-like domain
MGQMVHSKTTIAISSTAAVEEEEEEEEEEEFAASKNSNQHVKSHLKIQEEEEEEEEQQQEWQLQISFHGCYKNTNYPFTSTLHFVLRLMIRTQTEQEIIYSLLSLNFQLLNFLGFGTILLCVCVCVCVCVCFGFVGYVCCAELRILKFLSFV